MCLYFLWKKENKNWTAKIDVSIIYVFFIFPTPNHVMVPCMVHVNPQPKIDKPENNNEKGKLL
jgi:hypothetical protein